MLQRHFKITYKTNKHTSFQLWLLRIILKLALMRNIKECKGNNPANLTMKYKAVEKNLVEIKIEK